MNILDLLIPECVVCDEIITSKKRVLERLGELIASHHSELAADAIFDALIGRERLGSTGLGHGVALPHGRLKQGSRAIGAFIKLRQGIDFDAIDQQHVDLVFALLVPEHFTDEHLRILAHLAEMFSDEAFCRQLRGVDSDQALFERLTQWRPSSL